MQQQAKKYEAVVAASDVRAAHPGNTITSTLKQSFDKNEDQPAPQEKRQIFTQLSLNQASLPRFIANGDGDSEAKSPRSKQKLFASAWNVVGNTVPGPTVCEPDVLFNLSFYNLSLLPFIDEQ